MGEPKWEWDRGGVARPLLPGLVLVDRMSDDADDTGDFAAIAARYRPMLNARAWALCRSRSLADDLVQETFARALKNLAHYRPGTHVGAWLVTILTRVYLDIFKHDKVTRDAEPGLIAIQQTQFELVLEATSDTELYEAVQRLAPEQQQLIILCYFQQKKHREAAEILGIPIGTVGGRIVRALHRLREELSPESDPTP